MGPTWVLSAPDGPHVGSMNLAIRVTTHRCFVSPLCDNFHIHCLFLIVRWHREVVFDLKNVASHGNCLISWCDAITLRHTVTVWYHGDVIKWKHFPVTGAFPSQRPSEMELWCFLCLNKRLNKPSRRNRAHYDITVMPSSSQVVFQFHQTDNYGRTEWLLGL